MTPAREPAEATKAAVVRTLRAEAQSMLAQIKLHPTQAERDAAARALLRIADYFEKWPTADGGAGPTAVTEYAARLTGYDGRTEYKGISDDWDFVRALVEDTRRHMNSLNEPTRRMKGLHHVDPVRRHIATYADGGVYTGPWSLVQEGPRVEWGLRFSSRDRGDSQHPYRDETPARAMFDQHRRWLDIGGPEGKPQAEVDEFLAALKSIELLRRVVDVRADGEETPGPWVVVDTIEGRADR